MSDKTREEFEAWALREVCSAYELKRVEGCDAYYFHGTEAAWAAWKSSWKASRESLVIELPELMVTRPYQTVDRGSDNYKAGFNRAIFMAGANVAGAGLKVAP